MERVTKGFIGHVVEFWPILDDARKLGMPVDLNAMSTLKTELERVIEETNQIIQELVPDELKLLSPVRKDGQLGYKKTPKLVLELARTFEELEKNWNDRQGKEYENYFKLSFEEFLAKRKIIKYNKKTGKEIKRLTLTSKPVQLEDSSYKNIWYLRADFKPSKEQLSKYIEWKKIELQKSDDPDERKIAKFYNVPERLDIKTKELKQTTGKRALQDLLNRTGDDLLKLIIGDKDDEEGSLSEQAGIRSIKKVIDNDIPRWHPALDGSVHTTWGIKAASGQLDARSPNILNASKHTVIGKLFRQVISCPEDEILVECDKKSYHVATMGYCANDPKYIRFSQLDPHSYFTAYVANGVLGLPNLDTMGDDEILDICGRYKKDPKWKWVRQHISKVIVLGNQLGLGARKVFINQNDAVVDPISRTRVKPFRSVESIKTLQLMLGGMFGLVEKFKKQIRRIAHDNGVLVNDWGYCQKFWEVFQMQWKEEDNAWYQVPGTESEKAIAFLVQSNAFGDIRDKLIQLRNLGLLEKYPFVSSIHDSFVFRIKKKLLENFVADVHPILVSPSRRLIKPCCPDGLVVGVEISYGRNFADYDVAKNYEGMREFKIK